MHTLYWRNNCILLALSKLFYRFYNLYSVAVNTRKIDLYIQAVLTGDLFPLTVNVLTARVDDGNQPLPTPRAEQTRVLGHHGFRRSAEKLLHTHT